MELTDKESNWPFAKKSYERTRRIRILEFSGHSLTALTKPASFFLTSIP